MSNTIKVLINSDGITGRAKNPMDASDMKFSPEWDKFEATVKSYTVIGSCKAGDVVEADLIYQYKLSDQKDVWVASYVPVEVVNGETRRAYQVVEAKPEKSDDYKQGYVHALDSAAENDNLKIKRLEATIEMFRAENKSLSDQLRWYKKEYD